MARKARRHQRSFSRAARSHRLLARRAHRHPLVRTVGARQHLRPRSVSNARPMAQPTALPHTRVAVSGDVKVKPGAVSVYRSANGSTYRYVIPQASGHTRHVTVQLPASQRGASGSSSFLPVNPQKVPAAVASAIQNLTNLVRTGGGGLGKRIVPQLPVTWFLLGLMAVVAGSLLRMLSVVRPT